MRKEQAARESAIESLKKYIPRGSKVWGSIISVSRSGMSRRVRLYTIINVKDGKGIFDLSRFVGIACDRNVNDDGILMKGCGSDVVHDIITELSNVLYGKYTLLICEDL